MGASGIADSPGDWQNRPLFARGEQALHGEGDLRSSRRLFDAAYHDAERASDRHGLALAALGLGGLRLDEQRAVVDAATAEARATPRPVDGRSRMLSRTPSPGPARQRGRLPQRRLRFDPRAAGRSQADQGRARAGRDAELEPSLRSGSPTRRFAAAAGPGVDRYVVQDTTPQRSPDGIAVADGRPVSRWRSPRRALPGTSPRSHCRGGPPGRWLRCRRDRRDAPDTAPATFAGPRSWPLPANSTDWRQGTQTQSAGTPRNWSRSAGVKGAYPSSYRC